MENVHDMVHTAAMISLMIAHGEGLRAVYAKHVTPETLDEFLEVDRAIDRAYDRIKALVRASGQSWVFTRQYQELAGQLRAEYVCVPDVRHVDLF